ncbi:hypothetical protein PUNSTDRAFT_102022 [Punctularia strigosozonata HHB-11173 SS5]|uniref:uncharacterized protein n=1 Tax=Punctularia strigosozonata (strain HHB-11173) TaxID=741275 RepID=UPI0004417ADB|nr:uncharacterized protein PUNSTDRAFT_102022 [Punctularia strigosozonata HHB-11173 SS5]EIN10048.1 hypothetical protein PUNSTDRAFT_102022 [Punctularia strigosozonata HHB-11173 SS5]
MSEQGLSFVYYCSGHGYGHATRVSAFAGHLLSLNPQPTVYIVSSAPRHVFADSIAQGATYRYADIDPVVVQPLAYRVDRRKSVDVLKSFLAKKDAKLEEEIEFLKDVEADCVLSDAAFLGCLAAHACRIPSVLVTNFSFDSVYSYLSTTDVDQNVQDSHPRDILQAPSAPDDISPDVPIPPSELEPLVAQIHVGYRCADLLLLLPGAIPMPSFAALPTLPSPAWIDPVTMSFKPEILDYLARISSDITMLPSVPFSISPDCPDQDASPTTPDRIRTIREAPLLVRPTNASIYTPLGRSALLSSIGVPEHLHDESRTKILIVSFGGQSFRRPHSRAPSRAGSSVDLTDLTSRMHLHSNVHSRSPPSFGAHNLTPISSSDSGETAASLLLPSRWSSSSCTTPDPVPSPQYPPPAVPSVPSRPGLPRLASASHIFIPGAPPAAKTPATPTMGSFPTFCSITPASPIPTLISEDSNAWGSQTSTEAGANDESALEEDPFLLPDESWIAIVCGVPKEWGREHGEELPAGFYVAPKDVYMPDLTAAADVLLGKLGYGTVSECVDACTPFVYVPRPLFIEEHGLRLLLEREGAGVVLPRAKYEAGDWARAVSEAYAKGKDRKVRKRQEGETGLRKRQGVEIAQGLVKWVEEWLTHN